MFCINPWLICEVCQPPVWGLLSVLIKIDGCLRVSGLLFFFFSLKTDIQYYPKPTQQREQRADPRAQEREGQSCIRKQPRRYADIDEGLERDEGRVPCAYKPSAHIPGSKCQLNAAEHDQGKQPQDGHAAFKAQLLSYDRENKVTVFFRQETAVFYRFEACRVQPFPIELSGRNG